MEDANDRRLHSIERRCGALVSGPSDFLPSALTATSLKVVNAVRALHLIGYLHGDFFVEDWEQHRLYHHFLYDEVREKAFIIDFRRRARHDCELAFELREYKAYVPGYLFGCGELYTMAVALGLIRRRDSGEFLAGSHTLGLGCPTVD